MPPGSFIHACPMSPRNRLVAALYDIHGNLPALEAALADAESAGAELFVLGGDLALGPMPTAVLDRLGELGPRARYLRGNCDRLMVDAHDGRPLPAMPAAVRDTVAWAAGQLQRRHRDFLAGLPETVTLDIDTLGRTLFCHATPGSDEEIITVRTPDERLHPIVAAAGLPVVVCGHTHMQFDRRCGNVRVINAGSVGMPYGEPGAHWVLLGPDVDFRRTGYDTIHAARQIAETAYPNAADFAERHVVHPPSEEDMLAALER